MKNDIGIVVPTLGTRPGYLRETLSSIRAAGSAHISVVCPGKTDLRALVNEGLVDSIVEDPGTGLAAAINAGINHLPRECVNVSWLGDDDLLEPNTMDELRRSLEMRGTVFVWGRCRYIDSDGNQIFVNRSGQWALFLMRIGPNLLPQPGSLFRRDAFEQIGGLDTRWGWAFDQDLFVRLSSLGRGRFVPMVVSSFRWHAGSLSAGSREGSVRESSLIRLGNYPAPLRPVGRMWEVVVRRAVSYAGIRMNKLSDAGSSGPGAAE